MMQIRIDDSDLKELEKTLNKIIKAAPSEAEELMRDTAAHIEGQAKQLAPVDSGWLRKNITKGKDKDGFYVRSKAEYSLWVEFGNRWWQGISFFRPAIERGMEYLEQEVKNRFRL
jgi:hypothetical protein